MNLKYELLKNGQDLEFFHATEDRQATRDQVFEIINDIPGIEMDCVVVQKNKTHPSLRVEEEFYDKMSQTLLQYIFGRHCESNSINNIVVILGKIFTNKKRNYVIKSLKSNLKNKFKKPFYIYFHRSEADINCQIADYCGWATYIQAERNEGRPYQGIKSKIKSCFNIFSIGKTKYYSYKK